MSRSPLRRWLAVAAIALAPLAAQAYGSVVIFGDSLSDSGNNALLLGTDPGQVVTGNAYVPVLPYAGGTYSNGAVWATSFAAGLGLEALPSRAGGTDFAYGGAVTGGAGLPPSLRTQVDQYLATNPSGVADTLFVIAGGGNNARDALDRVAGGARPAVTALLTSRRYANDVGAMVDQLQALGAQHIVVWNTPDLGLVPAVTSQGGSAASFASQLTQQMNDALGLRLAGEAGVEVFDVYALLGTVVANPAAYGLVNVTDACGAVPACNAQGWLFWDGIHPTARGHDILAQGMLGLVAMPVPEAGSFAMMAGGLVLLLAWRRRQA